MEWIEKMEKEVEEMYEMMVDSIKKKLYGSCAQFYIASNNKECMSFLKDSVSEIEKILNL